MDEKSGMNFSEYMAILSGNTDLLDKAKLEKKIASLEGERKSFHRGKRDSELKLESKTSALRNNQAVIAGMTETGRSSPPPYRLTRRATGSIPSRLTDWTPPTRRPSASGCRR